MTFKNHAIRPEKCSGTRWIDHKLRAMAKLNDKFVAYASHLENVIADTSKKTDRATLQGKYNNLTEASVLLRSALLTDLLVPAKVLSLTSQTESVDVITIVNAVQSTRNKYKQFYTKYLNEPDKIFELPTLKAILEKVDDQNQYQGIKLKNYVREEEFIKNNITKVLEGLLSCLDQRCGLLQTDDENEIDDTRVRAEVKEGDTLLYHICRIFNSKVWPSEVNKNALTLQIESLQFVFHHYKTMTSLKGIYEEQVIFSYMEMV